jgi:hypothetical protein
MFPPSGQNIIYSGEIQFIIQKSVSVIMGKTVIFSRVLREFPDYLECLAMLVLLVQKEILDHVVLMGSPGTQVYQALLVYQVSALKAQEDLPVWKVIEAFKVKKEMMGHEVWWDWLEHPVLWVLPVHQVLKVKKVKLELGEAMEIKVIMERKVKLDQKAIKDLLGSLDKMGLPGNQDHQGEMATTG